MKRFTFLFVVIFAVIAANAQLPDNWSGDSGIETFQEATTVHGGSYSCGIIVNTDVQGDCDMDNEVEILVSEGDDFKINFWAYTSPNVRARAVFNWVGASRTYSDNYVGPGTSGWELLEFTEIVPDGATALNIGIRFYDVPGFTPPETQYVDDVTFESPVGEPLVVTNGDFENWPVVNPEPTNYPSDFNATALGSNIELNWSDATGGQEPDAYLIKISVQDNIALPVDGVFEIDDTDLGDGEGAINIEQGVETYTFSGLNPLTTYYLKIFPYTNAGTSVDYKTDGTPPSAEAAIGNIIIFNSENFDESWGEWATVNVIGEQVWDRDNTYGIGGTPCAKMSGHSTSSNVNEDWLISPAMNFDNTDNEYLTFYSAMGYPTGTPQLSVKISTDYDGGGDPGSATWNDLSPILASGDPFWQWTFSGSVDLSSFNGAAVYVAFVYISTAEDSETWEIDNILINGEGAYSPEPEPSNYPTGFSNTVNGSTVYVSWIDAIGDILPSAYLIKVSDQQNIQSPIDGNPEADDLDFSDGYGVVNVNFGVETFTFGTLKPNTIYYFHIYPYTNSGEYIDYKTDGTTPSMSATTGQIVVVDILFTDFNDDWGGWTTVSVIGQQVWDRDNSYGIGETPCAKMTGYEGASFENEDWLISPSLNLDNYSNEKLMFYSAVGYNGPALQLMLSQDYDGSGNPNDFTWTDLSGQATWAPSGSFFEWTPSGELDLSSFEGNSIFIAFVYTSTSDKSATWEVDDIKITGTENIGINEENISVMANVYPNPTNGIFNITTEANFNNLEIYSMTGQIVHSERISGKLIQTDVSVLQKGIYILKLSNTENGEFYSLNLIIY